MFYSYWCLILLSLILVVFATEISRQVSSRPDDSDADSDSDLGSLILVLLRQSYLSLSLCLSLSLQINLFQSLRLSLSVSSQSLLSRSRLQSQPPSRFTSLSASRLPPLYISHSPCTDIPCTDSPQSSCRTKDARQVQATSTFSPSSVRAVSQPSHPSSEHILRGSVLAAMMLPGVENVQEQGHPAVSSPSRLPNDGVPNTGQRNAHDYRLRLFLCVRERPMSGPRSSHVGDHQRPSHVRDTTAQRETPPQRLARLGPPDTYPCNAHVGPSPHHVASHHVSCCCA